MVKHPKRKKQDKKDASSSQHESGPSRSGEITGKRETSQEEPKSEKTDAQGKDGGETDTPPTEPPVDKSEALKSSTNPLNKIFWMRVALGVLAGAIAAQVGFSMDTDERIGLGIGSAIIFFIVSVVIAKAMRIPLPQSDRKKIVTTGMGSYVGMFLFVWILGHTIIHATSSKAFGPALANLIVMSFTTLWYDIIVPNINSYLLLY